ncbi:transmembrane 4 L6 family member 1-like [Colossoma macropomum]|uniref:transmembrane 4 L6 family member 1-like n=1 Tax=Colossoma macropomum TaxID=42526 RepID=UPI00186438F4|nr:transmembrane 4 L6 family member 1-like [Colossoma macropomum]
MCLGKCSRIIARYLYPLAFISMACNVLLFFPDWKITYALDNHLTPEVKHMGGLIGGGVMGNQGRQLPDAHVACGTFQMFQRGDGVQA